MSKKIWVGKKKFWKIFRFFSKISVIFHFIEKTTKIVRRVVRNYSSFCLKPIIKWWTPKIKKLRTSGFHRFYRFRDSDIVQICTTYHSMRNHRLFLKKVTFIFPKTGKKPVKIAKNRFPLVKNDRIVKNDRFVKSLESKLAKRVKSLVSKRAKPCF